jgi:putative membrane protein
MIDYDAHDWHRHLFDVRGTMVREIVYRVLAVVAWSVVVVYAHQRWRPFTGGVTVHSLVGVALGLLLVFRTNASYDRFWEGRKMWGGIVNETRNLARTSRALIAPADPALHAAVLNAVHRRNEVDEP